MGASISRTSCIANCPWVKCPKPTIPEFKCPTLECPDPNSPDIKCLNGNGGNLNCGYSGYNDIKCEVIKCPDITWSQGECPSANCTTLKLQCPKCFGFGDLLDIFQDHNGLSQHMSQCDVGCPEFECPKQVFSNYTCPQLVCRSIEVPGFNCNNITQTDIQCPTIKLPSIQCDAQYCPDMESPEFKCSGWECDHITMDCPTCFETSLAIVTTITALAFMILLFVCIYQIYNRYSGKQVERSDPCSDQEVEGQQVNGYDDTDEWSSDGDNEPNNVDHKMDTECGLHYYSSPVS